MNHLSFRSLSAVSSWAVFLLIWSIVSCQTEHKKEYFTEVGEVFHTMYQIQYAASEAQTETIKMALEEVNRSANPFDNTSLLYAINNNISMETDSTFRILFRQAMDISRITNGAYDVTIGPLVNVWGFGFEPSPYSDGNVPQRAIDSILAFVGFDKVILRDNKVYKKDPRTKIDFASIAKGFASSLVADALSKQGIHNYLVNIGGEIAFAGVNRDGKEWRIGINKPIQDSIGMEHYNDIETIIALPSHKKMGGLATSGNYHNYKVREDGSIYAHTIDPHTGKPIQTDVLSATIIANECSLADALATACMALGSERAVEILDQLEGVDYFLILGNNNSSQQQRYRFVSSSGFEALIVKE